MLTKIQKLAKKHHKKTQSTIVLSAFLFSQLGLLSTNSIFSAVLCGLGLLILLTLFFMNAESDDVIDRINDQLIAEEEKAQRTKNRKVDWGPKNKKRPNQLFRLLPTQQ